MAPLWYPKNIQKRLLLYVLQQLSFFSGIDIPNLEEISLRNVVLRNLSVDPDKLGKLPGCNFRHGIIGSIELSTSSAGSLMSGGLHITARDVELVISPNLNLDESLNESLMLTLVQSTAGLASSLLIDPEVTSNHEAVLNPSSPEEHQSRPDSCESEIPKSSTLGTVMQRAAELAMARLLVTIKNLKIKVVTDSADVELKVGEMTVKTIDGKRHVELAAVELVSPSVTEAPNSHFPNGKDESKSPYASGVDIPKDGAESLYLSAFSHPSECVPESTSSANLSQVLMCIDSIRLSYEGIGTILGLEVKVGTIVIALPSLLSTLGNILDNFSRNLTRDDVKHGGRQKLSTQVSPVATASDSTRIKTSSGPDSDQNSQSSCESSSNATKRFVEKINVGTIIVCVDSGITASGEYERPNSTRIVLRDLTFARRDACLAFGGVRIFKAIRTQSDGTVSTLFQFDEVNSNSTLTTTGSGAGDADAKADIRFEWHEPITTSVEANISVLLSKEALFILCPESAAAWTMCFDYIQKALRSHTAFTLNVARLSSSGLGLGNESHLSSEATQKTAFNLHTSTMTVTVKSAGDADLRLEVSPIQYYSQKSQFKAAKIYLDFISPLAAEPIRVASIYKASGSVVRKAFKPKVSTKFLGSASGTSSSNMYASFPITFKYVVVKAGGAVLKRVAEVILAFEKEKSRIYADMTRIASDNSIMPRDLKQGMSVPRLRKPRFVSSPKLELHGREASLLVKIDKVDVAVANLPFGVDEIELRSDEISFYLLDGHIYGTISSFAATLESKSFKLKDRLAEPFCTDPTKSSEPMASFSCSTVSGKTSATIMVHGTAFEYYTAWIEVFNTSTSSADDIFSTSADSSEKSPASDAAFSCDVVFHECVIGLNPGRLNSKACILLPEGTVSFADTYKNFFKAQLDNISLLLIDEIPSEGNSKQPHGKDMAGMVNMNPETFLHALGYVTVVTIDSIRGSTRAAISDRPSNKPTTKISVTVGDCDARVCADSLHALTQLLSDLKLPLHLSADEKFKVVVENRTNLMADLDMKFFEGVANTDLKPKTLPQAPDNATPDQASLIIDLKINSLHAYLYDGFDWKETRRTIRAAVRRIENSKKERRQEQHGSRTETTRFEEQGTSPISMRSSTPSMYDNSRMEETIFHSIHVAMPPSLDASALARRVNETIQGGPVALQNSEKAQLNASVGKNYKNLLLNRAASHSFAVVVNNAKVQLNLYRPENEDEGTISGATIRVEDIAMYDNVATSTWNKFLGYMTSLGDRELNSNILELGIETVRPQAGLAYTESIVSLHVLPLRAYVDQDTLNFLLRFLEFSDLRFQLPPEEITYFQSVTLGNLHIKLDYKPKRVDFAGIRSGRTSEFANFFVLDGANIKLPGMKQYGILGVSQLGNSIKNAWAPNFHQKQVLDIVAGMSPFRPLVNIGGGFKDLVGIPVHEYKSKNGHMMRGLQRGTKKFAKTTGYEILMMGAKMTSGAQALLEQGETYLGGDGAKTRHPAPSSTLAERKWDDSQGLDNKRGHTGEDNLLSIDSQHLGISSCDESRGHLDLLSKSEYVLDPSLSGPNRVDEAIDYAGDSILEYETFTNHDRSRPAKSVSLYANQPENVKEGLAMAYHSMENAVKSTSKMLQRIKGEVKDSENVSDQAGKIARSSPLLVIRPLIGTTEAISKTLMGISNGIDSQHMRDLREKYARQELDFDEIT